MSSQAQRFFDAIASRYDRVYALRGLASRERLERVLAELPPQARVLDLGVGTGRELSALLDANHHPTGLDFSTEMLAVCARRARPVPLVHADFWERLPFEDGSFDAAIALHGALAHPADDGSLQRLVAELGRVLAVHGVFVAEVPAPAWIDATASGEADEAGRKLTKTGPARCLYEDTVVGAAVEARALTTEEWRDLFAQWTTIAVSPVEATDARELRVVAQR